MQPSAIAGDISSDSLVMFLLFFFAPGHSPSREAKAHKTGLSPAAQGEHNVIAETIKAILGPRFNSEVSATQLPLAQDCYTTHE